MLQSMGNSNKHNIGQEFKTTCHQGLVDCKYDEKQQMLLLPIKAQGSLEHWKQDLEPLLRTNYLFVPHHFGKQQVQEEGCCMQEGGNNGVVTSLVFYRPFYYTLEKEILVRRQKNSLFREQQLWKLINYLSKAIAEWIKVYSEQKLGVICPNNVLLDPKGQVRLVTKLSFFLQVYGSFHQYYTPPQSRGTSLVKYALNPHSDPRAIEASLIFSAGSVILQAATLTLSDHESFSRDQKQMTFRNMTYSEPLKRAVLGMVQANQMSRFRLTELVEMVRANKNKH